MNSGLLLLIAALLAAAAVWSGMFAGYSRLAIALMVLRPACDKIFDLAKTYFAGAAGPGAAANILVLGLALAGVAGRPAILLVPGVTAWGLFLLTAAAAQLHSLDPSQGLRLLQSLATYAAAFCLPFILVRSASLARQLVWACLASSLIPVIWGLAIIMAQPGLFGGEERLESTFMHPNIFAFFIMGNMALILFILSSKLMLISLRLRGWLLAYLALLLLELLLTKTRSAWIATALLLAAYAVAVDRRWLILGLFAPVFLAFPGVWDRIFDLSSGNSQGGYAALNSYAWRQLLWQSALNWMAANPSVWLGNGLEMFQAMDPVFFPRISGTGVGAHNAFLQIYFEMGVLGLGAFALIFAAVIAHLGLRSVRDFAGSFVILVSCIQYFLVFYSDNLLAYLQYQWFFWFMTGTVLASTRYLPDRKKLRPALPARQLARNGLERLASAA